MASILITIGRISRKKRKWKYLKNQKSWSIFHCVSEIYIIFPVFRKENESHGLSISDIIHPKQVAT